MKKTCFKIAVITSAIFLLSCNISGQWKVKELSESETVYTGEVELSGWLVHGPSFADSWEDRKDGWLYFMVTNESLNSLPEGLNFSLGYENLFRLENYNGTQAAQLEYSSKQKPAQILTKKITTNGHVIPTMELKKILKTVDIPREHTDENGWKLVYGLEPSPDPWALVYEGYVDMEGWIVDVPVYVGPQTSPHLRIAESTRDRLPKREYKKYDFVLSEKTQGDLIDQLRKYDEKNPARIIVHRITFVMEGSPHMEISRVLE